MLVNLLFLLCVSLIGHGTKRLYGFNVSTFLTDIGAVMVMLVVAGPVALFMLAELGAGPADPQALNKFIDDYFIYVANFIGNQTPGWIIGYLASYIVGAVTGSSGAGSR